MDNPRPDKVAVVDEVRAHFDQASGAILTEYRGLTVKDLANLRRSLREAGRRVSRRREAPCRTRGAE